uniref:Uncharacterized protein n=1 Tax=viral metagenome TaxID=1070528 RepID=A0A6H2A1E5_9ZZZZ
MPIRVTPTQAAAMQRRLTPAERRDETPPKPKRAKHVPIRADQPPEPTVLLSVAIEPPGVPGGFWTVVAEYNNGSTAMSSESEEAAKEWKAKIETYWKER